MSFDLSEDFKLSSPTSSPHHLSFHSQFWVWLPVLRSPGSYIPPHNMSSHQTTSLMEKWITQYQSPMPALTTGRGNTEVRGRSLTSKSSHALMHHKPHLLLNGAVYEWCFWTISSLMSTWECTHVSLSLVHQISISILSAPAPCLNLWTRHFLRKASVLQDLFIFPHKFHMNTEKGPSN